MLMEKTLNLALFALGASWLIGHWWPTPRPFMMPVGQTFLEHAATPAFPSNHATIMLTIGFSLLLSRIGRYLLLLAVPVAWARVFLGVHFPQDMLGALLLAAGVAALVGVSRSRLVLPFYHHVARRLYHLLFAPLISRGWVERCHPVGPAAFRHSPLLARTPILERGPNSPGAAP